MAIDSIGIAGGSAANIATHSFFEGEDKFHIERVAPGAGIVAAWEDIVVDVGVTGLVSDLEVDTKGRGRIVVKAMAIGSLYHSFAMSLVFYDANGDIMGLSPSTVVQFGGLQDAVSGKNYSVNAVFPNDVCASSAKVFLYTLPPSGYVDLTLAAQ